MGWGFMFFFFSLLALMFLAVAVFGIFPKIGNKINEYFKWEEDEKKDK